MVREAELGRNAGSSSSRRTLVEHSAMERTRWRQGSVRRRTRKDNTTINKYEEEGDPELRNLFVVQDEMCLTPRNEEAKELGLVLEVSWGALL